MKKQIHFYFSTLLFIPIILSLAACGGGGSEGGDTPAAVDTTNNNDPVRPVFNARQVTSSLTATPNGDISDTSPTFTWKPIANASEYQLGHEDYITNLDNWRSYTKSATEMNCTSQTCSYTPTDYTFNLNENRAWWVRAKVNGVWLAWSNPHVFKIIEETTIVAIPEAISPNGDINNTSPTFSWKAIENANAYEFGHEDYSPNPNIVEDTWRSYTLTTNNLSCNNSTCSHTPNDYAFSNGNVRGWWVRANVNGVWSDWSTVSVFTIVEQAEHIAAIADSVSTDINTPISIPVLANDIGSNIEVSFILDYTAQSGQTSIVNNEILYSPLEDFSGIDTFWYTISNGVTIYAAEVVVTVGEFEQVDMRTNVLLKRANTQDWINSSLNPNNQTNDTGLVEKTVMSDTSAGTIQLTLNDSSLLAVDQVISYLADDNEYYTSSIASINGTTITLDKPLVKPLHADNKMWNFYADSDHPNEKGSRAIADHALRSLQKLNQGTHVLLGDSWFDSPDESIANRLAERLPNATIINRGIGGSESNDIQLRFDNDVASENPDVVWIMTGTNDQYAGITAAEYKANIKVLVDRIKDLGARAIIFNAAIGSNDSFAAGTQAYADALSDLIQTYTYNQ